MTSEEIRAEQDREREDRRRLHERRVALFRADQAKRQAEDDRPPTPPR